MVRQRSQVYVSPFEQLLSRFTMFPEESSVFRRVVQYDLIEVVKEAPKDQSQSKVSKRSRNAVSYAQPDQRLFFQMLP